MPEPLQGGAPDAEWAAAKSRARKAHDAERRAEIAKLRKFARGRISVAESFAGPGTGFAPRFRPRVAGLGVAPHGMPSDGYLSRHEALVGANAYRESCRVALAAL